MAIRDCRPTRRVVARRYRRLLRCRSRCCPAVWWCRGGRRAASAPSPPQVRDAEPGVAHLEVVDIDRGHLVEHRARGVQSGRRAPGGGVHPGQQGSRQGTRLFAFDGAEIAVARRHRQPVGFTHDRHADDRHVDVQVGDHLTDQHQLLVVLLTEERPVWPHDLQQLEHHGQHTREMRWPRRTFKLRSKRAGLHGGARSVRVHLRRSRGEGDLDTFGAQLREVVVEGLRVFVEVLVGAELQRVDEDRHHHDRARHPLGRPHQRQVTLVQGTHRRHQHHASPGLPQRARDIGDVARRGVDVELAGGELWRLAYSSRLARLLQHREDLSGACARCAVRNEFARYACASSGIHFGQGPR